MLPVALLAALVLVPLGASTPAQASTGTLRVITEPSDAMAFLDHAVGSARRSVDVEMYELSDPTFEAALEARASAGVRVSVLLDRDYTAGSENQAAAAALAARHVAVHWTYATEIFHEKAVVVDDATAYVGTGNLTQRYYATTRDFWVADTIPADVAAVTATFGHDWTGAPPAPAPRGADLVWSPGAEGTFLSLIAGARHSIALESEEMAAKPVIAALAAAARRGVVVHVTMTYDSSWASAFRELEAAGVKVHVDHGEHPVYIHAKALCIDCTTGPTGTGRVLVGSQNLGTGSLTYNRELGILTSQPSVEQPVARVLAADFESAGAYSS
jgi:phosphatidylserine/phosphatidylglycerophosphate/cardiolipin synthase-like enzyme